MYFNYILESGDELNLCAKNNMKYHLNFIFIIMDCHFHILKFLDLLLITKYTLNLINIKVI